MKLVITLFFVLAAFSIAFGQVKDSATRHMLAKPVRDSGRVRDLSLARKDHTNIPDADIEGLMTKRVFTCDNAGLNAVVLIPWYYRRHLLDSVNAILQYMEMNCGMIEPFFTCRLLLQIKDRTFNEQISKLNALGTPWDLNYYKKNILSYLHWYQLGYHIRTNPYAYSPENASTGIVKDYGDYYDFLKALARSLCDTPGLSPIEDILVHVYATGDTSYLRKLPEERFDGTTLKDVYLENVVRHKNVSGFTIALTGGVWSPQGGLSALGMHPSFGLTLGGRRNRFMYDFNYSEKVGTTPGNFAIRYHDTSFLTNQYEGHYAGLEFGYQLFRIKNNEADLLWGVAIDAFDVSFDSTRVNNTFSSFDANVGLGYTYFWKYKKKTAVERFSYISLRARYHYLNYNNPGGTDLTGNSFTFGIVYGLYRHKLKYYYSLP